MKNYYKKFQALNLAFEYYSLEVSPTLSDSKLERLEKILKISESNPFLNSLITEIDIDLVENSTSPKEVKEYCNKLRKKIKIYMKESALV